jgi:hypothetical protein
MRGEVREAAPLRSAISFLPTALPAPGTVEIPLNLKLCGHDLLGGSRKCEDVMTAIAKVLTLGFPGSSLEAEILKTLAICCGVGVLISVCAASYGLDLSPGFF